jgi:hypothetical protein
VSENIAPLIIKSVASREDRKGLVTCGMDGCDFGRDYVVDRGVAEDILLN